MTIDEVYTYFGSGRKMELKIGLTHSNFLRWRKRGYIPIETQIRIERLTNGDLTASLSHCSKEHIDGTLD